MISVKAKGDYKKALKKLEKLSRFDIVNLLNIYGAKGVASLKNATPKDTGLTANSWDYEIRVENGVYNLTWINTHVEGGYANIAILLDVGHGTATGGYVSGKKYIDAALLPIIGELKHEIWAEVISDV